jgi:predicted transcriptional regulator
LGEVTGASIRRLREEGGLTQKRLAELAGVSQAHVAKIEQGKVDPRLSTVNRILSVLSAGKKKKCGDVMTKGVLFAKPNDSVLRASEVMVKNGISQMPVMIGVKIVGTITEEGIVRNLGLDLSKERVKKVMEGALPTVSEEMSVDAVRPLLERYAGVLVARNREIVGIITRSDLLRTIA